MNDKCPMQQSFSMDEKASRRLVEQKNAEEVHPGGKLGEQGPQQQLSGLKQPQQKLTAVKQHFLQRPRSLHLGSSEPAHSTILDAAEYLKFQTFSPRRFHQAAAGRSGNMMSDEERAVNADNAPACNAPVSTRRYFDALEGPELDVAKDSEDEFLLPLDEKWPFLLRFPINTFGIVLGLGSQAILWKALAASKSMRFLHISPAVNFVLWCAALVAYVVIFVTYVFKCVFYLEAVRREYFHPVRINYFFSPWIGGMFLAIGLPDVISKTVHPAVWCVFMTPLVLLELKIYGQWLSGGDRRLSRVANPSTHLSVVGNFVGALLATRVGWIEPAIFFWSVGLAHYVVVFVTCYQRLPTNSALTKDLHPVFFLFIAAPSTASVAWEAIMGDFGYVSRFVYFVAVFLLLSLAVRINFFRGIRFSTSWWAYTFPLGAASVATIHYSEQVTCTFTRFLVLLLSLAATVVVFSIFVLTICHAFLWGTLFPNDLAIAITEEKRKRNKTSSSSGSFFKNKVQHALQRKWSGSADQKVSQAA